MARPGFFMLFSVPQSLGHKQTFLIEHVQLRFIRLVNFSPNPIGSTWRVMKRQSNISALKLVIIYHCR
jgi:hypothetical protein